ncbi:MAG: hypothetical protein AAB177_01435, partial [Nitrospirota bacterium]
MVISSGRCAKRCERHACLRARLSVTCRVFFGLLLLTSFTGCDRAPAPAEENKTKHSAGEARL